MDEVPRFTKRISSHKVHSMDMSFGFLSSTSFQNLSQKVGLNKRLPAKSSPTHDISKRCSVNRKPRLVIPEKEMSDR